MDSKEEQALRTWALDLGIELTSHQLRLLGIHLDELWEWNKKTNLTGLHSRKKVIIELFLDSMIPSTLLPDKGRLLDVGSGAGFPGIPLTICKPTLTACFLEANSKKASFLKQVIRLTELRQIKVIRGRIEKSKDRLHLEGYHVVTARAVAHLAQVCRWCAPHLMQGGMLVNFQGEQFEKTLEESTDEIERHGLALHKITPYSLPEKGSQRHLLIFKKLKCGKGKVKKDML